MELGHQPMSQIASYAALSVCENALPDDVRAAIQKLASLHEGDKGVVDAVACGRRAIPELRTILFEREPSGLYEIRRRAVEALAQIHAYDELIDYLRLSGSREIADPVERTGEDAVMNAAARALADARDDTRVLPLLLALTQGRPLAGVVDALGKLGCRGAIPYFIRALGEDFTRQSAEVALRDIGRAAYSALLETATIRQPAVGSENVSSVRRRRSALALIAEQGPMQFAPADDWLMVSALLDDSDLRIAALACQIWLARAPCTDKDRAVRRLRELLPTADWLLSEEIADCLETHSDVAQNRSQGLASS
jgi:hypothetical protein